MGWCDPCAAELFQMMSCGSWACFGWARPALCRNPSDRPLPRGGPQNVFITRLHLRYDRQHFPEDLVFQETGDRSNFQGRYVLRQPWTGSSDCPAGRTIRKQLAARRRTEAETLAS